MIKILTNKIRDFIIDYIIVNLRYYYWKLLIKTLGKNVKFWGSVKMSRPLNVSIGDNCEINDFVLINSWTELIIGKGVIISGGVIINTGGLNYNSEKREHLANKVIIEDNVWIGANAIINPNVKIGTNSVIGAGAVVTKDVPPYSVSVGVPAKVMKKIINNRQS